MVGECEQLRVFSTDGEKALIDAFSHEFPFATHLTCFIHVRRNIKEELGNTLFPQDVQTEILDDIFGKKVGTTLYEGLVDASDEVKFEEKLELLQTKWMKQEHVKEEVQAFCKWFLKNKASVVKHTMLRTVREEAGLGSPPDAFYTNASESINSVIKTKVQFKRNELPQFITKLKELVEDQQREVEKAVIGRGKYRLRQEYKYLEVSDSKWFSMTREQRLSHIKKVASTAVSDTRELVDEESCRSHTSLSADILCLAANTGLPVTALQAIGDKARELLETAGAITPTPGQSPDACMVLSRTGK